METTVDKCRTCKNAFTTSKGRLYCKKSLADKDDCGEYEKALDDTEKRYDDVLDKIKAEIEQVVAEESTEDLKWALGLKYAIKIIDKYKTEQEVST